MRGPDINPAINYGNNPISAEEFSVELRCPIDDKGSKFVVLNMRTRYGNAAFILLPEEVKVLSDVLTETIRGIDLNDEYIPKSKIIEKRREMFPDI